MANSANGINEDNKRNPGWFTKNDTRINRKGRPKSFDALRELALAIAHEVEQVGGKDFVINDKKVTVAERILRQWANSKSSQLQMAFIEIAFGKPPNNVNVKSSVETNDVVLYLPEKDKFDA